MDMNNPLVTEVFGVPPGSGRWGRLVGSAASGNPLKGNFSAGRNEWLIGEDVYSSPTDVRFGCSLPLDLFARQYAHRAATLSPAQATWPTVLAGDAGAGASTSSSSLSSAG